MTSSSGSSHMSSLKPPNPSQQIMVHAFLEAPRPRLGKNDFWRWSLTKMKQENTTKEGAHGNGVRCIRDGAHECFVRPPSIFVMKYKPNAIHTELEILRVF